MNKLALFFLLLPAGLLAQTSGLPAIWQITSLKAYGAIGDGSHPTQDTAALTAGITAVCASGGSLYIPAGTYNFDNSTSALTVSGCKGRIYGDGDASQIVFSTLANDGFVFSSVNAPVIDHIAVSYGPATTTRQSTAGYTINISGGTNPLVDSVTFSNGNISGLRLGTTTGAVLHNLSFSDFLANGIYGPNNYEFTVDGITGNLNGDGLVEFDCGISGYSGNCGYGTISNVLSQDDVTGILLNGTPQMAVTNCEIVRPAHQGILVEQDGGGDDDTVYPDFVSINNCNVHGAGTSSNPSNVATAVGFSVSIAGTPATKQHISYSNSIVEGGGGRGIQLADTNTVDLKLDSLHLLGNGTSGATGSNGSAQASIYTNGDRVEMSAVTVENSAGPSLYVNSTGALISAGFTSINPNSTANTTNAIYITSTNTFNALMMNNTTLTDSGATNRSGITNAATAGSQFIQGITTNFAHAWPALSNANSTASIYLASQHTPVSGGTPTAGTPVATYAGTGATASITAGGTDNRFQINLTTGTSLSPGTGSGGSVLLQTSFTSTFAATPVCIPYPANVAAGLAVNDILPGGSTGQFNLSVGGTALTASTAYKWNVVCQ